MPGGDGAAPAVCCRAVGWRDPDRFWLRLAWPGYFEDSAGLVQEECAEEEAHGGAALASAALRATYMKLLSRFIPTFAAPVSSNQCQQSAGMTS